MGKNFLNTRLENVIRIKSELDIPMFLWNSILVARNEIHVIGDNTKSYPLNSVFRWNPDPSAKTGYVIKCIDPIKENLVEKNGVFYKHHSKVRP